MTRAKTAVAALAAGVVAVAVGIGITQRDRDERPALTAPVPGPVQESTPESHQGFIYGRVTTRTGAVHEGRIRFAGEEEAFWGDYFNGAKRGNPWVEYSSDDQIDTGRSIGLFGFEIGRLGSEIDLSRPFMARFGDITRIEGSGRDLWVTLKSGTTVHLDGFEADDFADGVRVWSSESEFVDLGERRIRTIEFLPSRELGTTPGRLYGTVRTADREFTGFLQWDREEGVASDALDGFSSEGDLSIKFDSIRSIARRSLDSAIATLVDGTQVVLAEHRNVGRENRGVYVNDSRYGRVLVSWDAFEQVDLVPAGNGPAYGDFPAGRPLTGVVTTRDGHRLAGRLVYDLDESESVETLDAPSNGVDYSVLLGLIASIVVRPVETADAGSVAVVLHSGEQLRLERSGDLGDGNGGMLIFLDDGQRPEYVPWSGMARIDFDRPTAMYPPVPQAPRPDI